MALGTLVLGLASVSGATQEEDPWALYRKAEYQVAATGFRAQAEADPLRWSAWYNVAAAEYTAGRDADAAVALRRALDLAPRAELARWLWNTLEREHEPLREARPRITLSPGELWLLALALAWVGSGRYAFRLGPHSLRWGILGAAAVAALLAVNASANTSRPSAFSNSPVAFRRSPHGLAPETGEVPALAALWLERRQAEWYLVRNVAGLRGWVPARTLALVRALD